ncbi:MAG: HD domain-containing phosphohydrolase [Dermatophilus congolensis]|nr:HD domain-containing phosphohydrolase [Dermatophilus congolensis]
MSEQPHREQPQREPGPDGFASGREADPAPPSDIRDLPHAVADEPPSYIPLGVPRERPTAMSEGAARRALTAAQGTDLGDDAPSGPVAWLGPIAMILAAALVTWLATLRLGGIRDIQAGLTVFIGLLVLGVVGDVLRKLSREDEVELSFTAVLLLGAIPLTGPVPAVLLGPLIMVISPVVSRIVHGTRGANPLPYRTPLVFAVNASMLALVTAAAAFVYGVSGGMRVSASEVGPDRLLLSVGVPLLLADLTITLLNAVLVGAYIAATSAHTLRSFVTGALPVSLLLYLGYGVTAFILVVLWGPVGVGPLALVLILAPLLMSRWSYLEYVEERETHGRLLGALAVAGELRRGNIDRSARIGNVCEAIEAELGLPTRDRQVLKRAGALHDVGIVSVPWDVLDAEPGSLDDADLDRVEAHPRVSYEVLRGIDFLEGSAEAVLHHHERFDGFGYPDGLKGAEIPIGSRVLAVVDVAEAVGRGVDRDCEGMDQVIEALREQSGTMLDPDVVEALVRALRSPRGERLFADLLDNEPAGGRSRRSHALPTMSDVLAARARTRRGVS